MSIVCRLAITISMGLFACNRGGAAQTDGRGMSHQEAPITSLRGGAPERAYTAPPTEITDETFVEGVRARDPFRVFLPCMPPPHDYDLDVVFRDVPLDALRVTAIVRDANGPRALVASSANESMLLRRGQYVGRGEVLTSGRGQQYLLHWRVARIELAHLRRLSGGAVQEIPAQVAFERIDNFQQGTVVERVLTLSPDDARTRLASVDARLRADRLTR